MILLNFKYKPTFLNILSISLILTLVIQTAPPVISLNRSPSIPFISGDGFRSMANHVFDETDDQLDPQDVKTGDIVFVKTDMLDRFFLNVHPFIEYQYILVSHNADHGAPGPFELFLNDKKIFKWFGQNPTVSNIDKFIPIPIGIANRYLSHGNIEHFLPFWNLPQEKEYLLGINFIASTNPIERNPLLKMFNTKNYCTNICGMPHQLYLEKMSATKFILSPPGNGLDCHRTWESLIVSTIPILRSSTLDPLLIDLPILIVNDWSEINEQFLKNEYKKIKPTFYKRLKKLTFIYWQNLLTRYQNEIKKNATKI